MTHTKAAVFAFAITLSSTIAIAQTDSTTTPSNPVYQLMDDSITSFKIRVGQELTIGEGSGEHGWYQSIGFKSAFAYPIWLFRKSELRNEYGGEYGSSQYRENDKVKENLVPGQKLRVLKIKKRHDKTIGSWYCVYLKDTEFPGLKYWCDIERAIKNNELIVY